MNKSENDYILIGDCKISSSTEIKANCIIGKPYRKLFCGTNENMVQTIIDKNSHIGYGCIIGNGSHIGSESILDDNITIETNVSIGSNSLIIYNSHICSNAKIGDNCVIGGFICDRAIIGNNCRVFGKITHSQLDPTSNWDSDDSREESPIIFDNVFIGMNALITAPVRIGPNSYVTAGSIISKDVPSGFIAYGVNKIIHHSKWKGKLKNSKIFK